MVSHASIDDCFVLTFTIVSYRCVWESEWTARLGVDVICGDPVGDDVGQVVRVV